MSPLTIGDVGSHSTREPFLLVAEKNAILQINITSGSTITLPVGFVGSPIALDYDPLTDYVYWSEQYDYQINRCWGLALDNAGGNIYWSTWSKNTISVAKNDGSSVLTLLTSPAIGRPDGLVLDPSNGLMYWMDDNDGRVDRAAMDGSDQTNIITGLDHVEAIKIDYND
ncbi:LRP6 [Branchiostoma lanceolatum]|uniref:LRP6 protein n=1 Tax=Branchiostoma lanceolatum TaxID=7740 RepID=A0A8J9Z7E6_BRALA|nr:LRP6 [Branchiostoma lanceolatum]